MATNRKTRNRMLARAMRQEELTPNGDVWQEAKVIRDALIEGGETPARACKIAASHVRMWGTALQPKEAPVTQVHEPKRMPEQAKRVAAGEVMRDSKGRILPRATQEAYEALSSLARA